MNPTTTAGFKCFPQLNGLGETAMLRDRSTMTRACVQRYFTSDTLQDKVVRALSSAGLMPVKEILESFEFFQRVRKDVRASHLLDLCCGHGFVGMLFALFERRVHAVTLLDRREPDCTAALLDCVARVGPWVPAKVTFVTSDISDGAALVPRGTSTVSSHACGILTDRVIDTAIALGGAVAVMPCCYPKRRCRAPQALSDHLGHDVAFDVDRTYRLSHAGYHVRWTAIPGAITHMNRVLTGRPPRPVNTE